MLTRRSGGMVFYLGGRNLFSLLRASTDGFSFLRWFKRYHLWAADGLASFGVVAPFAAIRIHIPARVVPFAVDGLWATVCVSFSLGICLFTEAKLANPRGSGGCLVSGRCKLCSFKANSFRFTGLCCTCACGKKQIQGISSGLIATGDGDIFRNMATHRTSCRIFRGRSQILLLELHERSTERVQDLFV